MDGYCNNGKIYDQGQHVFGNIWYFFRGKGGLSLFWRVKTIRRSVVQMLFGEFWWCKYISSHAWLCMWCLEISWSNFLPFSFWHLRVVIWMFEEQRCWATSPERTRVGLGNSVTARLLTADFAFVLQSVCSIFQSIECHFILPSFPPRSRGFFIPRRVDEFTLCTCEIAEGRMHQIRLHMSRPQKRRSGEVVREGPQGQPANQGRQRWAHPLSRNSTTKKPSRWSRRSLWGWRVKFSSKHTWRVLNHPEVSSGIFEVISSFSWEPSVLSPASYWHQFWAAFSLCIPWSCRFGQDRRWCNRVFLHAYAVLGLEG